MTRYYCDLCGKEIQSNQARYGLSMVNIDKDKPAMESLEICPFCEETIKEQVNKWRVQ